MTIEDARAAAYVNHDWLTDEFVRLLLLQDPASVLDVGCGKGQLVQACAAAGIPASGVDQAGPRLDALLEAGVDVRVGTAYDLPYEDGEVDWITLRHVPHHLEDPPRAFAEALRVARTGIHLAEPWYNLALPSQRGSLAVDLWEKRMDRIGGMYHAAVLDLDELLAAFPSNILESHEIHAHRSLRLCDRSLPDYREVAELRLSKMENGADEMGSLDELFGGLAETGLSWNGSLIVTLRKRDA